MRRSTGALFLALVVVVGLTVFFLMMRTVQDPNLKPYLELAAYLKKSFGCASVTIHEAGPEGSQRLRISYVVGDPPTVADPQKEEEGVADVALSLWKESPIVGVDVERRVRRGGGGCEEKYDSSTFSKNAPTRHH